MWIPRDLAHVEAAIAAAELVETASFDGKADLPQPKKNSDLAVDVAAMTTEGGCLLYGVSEDENERLTVRSPITLAGAADRVGQIVQTSIAEVPYIDVREYPLEDDASQGFLLVIVPQSARAPHQVTVGDDRRYYGRGARGNRRLTEAEVAALYRRREDWEQNRDALLAEVVAAAPYKPHEDFGYVHAFVRPVSPQRAIWTRAVAHAGDEQTLHERLKQATGQWGNPGSFSPALASNYRWRREGADAWRLASSYDADLPEDGMRYVAEAIVQLDGSGRMFCGRAADRGRGMAPGESPPLTIFEGIIAGNLAGFFAAMQTLYLSADYHGHVDVGVKVTGLTGGVSHDLQARASRGIFFLSDLPRFSEDSYARTERIAAAELANPERLTVALLADLFAATTGQNDYSPFPESASQAQ